MTVREMVDKYAAEKNHTTMTNAQFIGQAVTEGIAIENHGDTKIIARVHRDKSSAWITETERTWEYVGSKPVDAEPVEVARANY